MRVFPCSNVLHAHFVVGVILRSVANIENHQRANQALGGNLVDGPRACGEMRGRVEMRTVMFLGAEVARVISIALEVAQFGRLKRRLLRAFPVGRAVVQRCA